jgi:hypothetical protein
LHTDFTGTIVDTPTSIDLMITFDDQKPNLINQNLTSAVHSSIMLFMGKQRSRHEQEV